MVRWTSILVIKSHPLFNEYRDILQLFYNLRRKVQRLKWMGVYNYIEKYRCSNGHNDKGLYTYNFCINTDPKIYQPSGSINMNKFKNIELEMTLLSPNVDDDRKQSLVICDENGDIIGVSKSEEIYEYTYEMHLFEERYNILRVMSNAGLLFAGTRLVS